MRELETSKHLFQRPLYCNRNSEWTHNFTSALKRCRSEVHLDAAAIASFLSFGMVGQERTLLKEVKRRPWMSEVTKGDIHLEDLPIHGYLIGTDDVLAKKFYDLLCQEARVACAGFSEIYILLSGGLDSRIIAGILSKLYQCGDISAKPFAITWGMPDSRDVVYAQNIAAVLGLEWKHIEFGPETVLDNINATARFLGAMHSPELLHNMLWFKNIPDNALVIAGSFGDSIGRAEFAGLHLLQLQPKTPSNPFQLMHPGFFHAASVELKEDLHNIYTRAQGNVPSYARNEHWMQGYRMRGGLCHALSIINSYAHIYQMFTAPEVYKFMWSLHPARRDDEIYAAMMEKQFPALAKIPWARTNRSLRGATHGAIKGLRAHYHEYTKWSSGPLYADLSKRIDPEWFDATGIFNPKSIQHLNKLVKSSQERVGRLNDIWLWLAGFRTFHDYIESNGKRLIIESDWPKECIAKKCEKSYIHKIVNFAAGKSMVVNSALKSVRSHNRKLKLKRLKKEALSQFPPIEIKDFDV